MTCITQRPEFLALKLRHLGRSRDRGGGFIVIVSAPNPAGIAILKDKFDGGVVSAGKLLLAAIPPTIVAAMAFRLL